MMDIFYFDLQLALKLNSDDGHFYFDLSLPPKLDSDRWHFYLDIPMTSF